MRWVDDALKRLAPTCVHCDDLVLRAAASLPAPKLAEQQVQVVVVDEQGDPVEGTYVCYPQRLANGVETAGSSRVDARGRANPVDDEVRIVLPPGTPILNWGCPDRGGE